METDMITPLSGYDLEQLQTGDEIDLHRGHHRAGAASVLVRVVKTVPPAPKLLGRFEHELTLAKDLNEEWALHPLALVNVDGRAALVLTDPGGLPLDALLGGRPSELTPALHIAVSLAAAIRRVHARGLIHRDIKPSNVVVNPGGAVHLTGFGIASRLLRERQVPIAPEAISGTFAYMAPEQTGRMNRSVDARTDLYSLGVTLYELLTGALPFQAADALEWIHCHIARAPQPPGTRVAGLPAPLDAIVLKLLAKNAE